MHEGFGSSKWIGKKIVDLFLIVLMNDHLS